MQRKLHVRSLVPHKQGLMHSCNPSPGDVEAGALEIKGHLQLHNASKLEDSLGSMKPCLKEILLRLPVPQGAMQGAGGGREEQ